MTDIDLRNCKTILECRNIIRDYELKNIKIKNLLVSKKILKLLINNINEVTQMSYEEKLFKKETISLIGYNVICNDWFENE